MNQALGSRPSDETQPRDMILHQRSRRGIASVTELPPSFETQTGRPTRGEITRRYGGDPARLDDCWAAVFAAPPRRRGSLRR
jgi:hypothetical protein